MADVEDCVAGERLIATGWVFFFSVSDLARASYCRLTPASRDCGSPLYFFPLMEPLGESCLVHRFGFVKIDEGTLTQ